MNKDLSKLLDEIQNISIEISSKKDGKYHIFLDYNGGSNSMHVFYTLRNNLDSMQHLEESGHIGFKSLKIIKRKLKKMLEE